MNPINRTRRARKRAGLSITQAARMLGDVDPVFLRKVEEDIDVTFRTLSDKDVAALADIYGVNVPWLRGDVPQHDYDFVRTMRGGDALEGHDRDVIAEFAASMPRKPRT